MKSRTVAPGKIRASKQLLRSDGPANPNGLHIRSFTKNGEVVAVWKPEKKYEAFNGVLNGGIIGTLLDCHCNWTAAYHLMKRAGDDRPPCTVTAEYANQTAAADAHKRFCLFVWEGCRDR